MWTPRIFVPDVKTIHPIVVEILGIANPWLECLHGKYKDFLTAQGLSRVSRCLLHFAYQDMLRPHICDHQYINRLINIEKNKTLPLLLVLANYVWIQEKVEVLCVQNSLQRKHIIPLFHSFRLSTSIKRLFLAQPFEKAKCVYVLRMLTRRPGKSCLHEFCLLHVFVVLMHWIIYMGIRAFSESLPSKAFMVLHSSYSTHKKWWKWQYKEWKEKAWERS